jgi:hypothetical protein
MNVLHGANLIALWDSCSFLFGFGSATKMQPLRKPRILRIAIAILFFYLSLAYTCTICESVLSATSDAIPFAQQTEYKGSWPSFARQLNQTLCASYNMGMGSDLCGMWDGSAYVAYHI